ncbi:PAC2 family protein [Candidatus Woesearchaeota archaeon]|nr:PAC2 family protein [Candidatus Woesearchaeota archaeon]
MEIALSQKPKSPVVISGFPGVGMVGAIAAEFLIQHLGTKQIGKIILDKSPALVAIHDGKLIEPFGAYYSSKHNIVVLHSIGGRQLLRYFQSAAGCGQRSLSA